MYFAKIGNLCVGHNSRYYTVLTDTKLGGNGKTQKENLTVIHIFWYIHKKKGNYKSDVLRKKREE